jgi:hypothetical protein
MTICIDCKHNPKNGKSSYCKDCIRVMNKKYYEKNKKQRIEYSIKRGLTNKFKIDNIKSAKGCLDCGIIGKPGWFYDMDHVGTKNKIIARMVTGGSWASILKELENCETRCVNCHRIKTYFRKYGNFDTNLNQFSWFSKKQLLVRNFKDKKCVDCGKKYHFSAMDCDHRTGVEKIDNIATLTRAGSLKTLINELEKCEVVCACCHRARTASQLKYQDGTYDRT